MSHACAAASFCNCTLHVINNCSTKTIQKEGIQSLPSVFLRKTSILSCCCCCCCYFCCLLLLITILIVHQSLRAIFNAFSSNFAIHHTPLSNYFLNMTLTISLPLPRPFTLHNIPSGYNIYILSSFLVIFLVYSLVGYDSDCSLCSIHQLPL